MPPILLTTRYCDLIDGDDANPGNAPDVPVKTLNKLVSLLVNPPAVGGVGLIFESPPPTKVAAVDSSSWQSGGPPSVDIDDPIAANIFDGAEGSWVPSANVMTSVVSGQKVGSGCQLIQVLDGFTTGKAAYYTLPAPLNLSNFQQVSLWLKQVSGNLLGSSQMVLNLCSDTTGDVTVAQVSLPTLTGAALGQWMRTTRDTGAPLGASIASVSLAVQSDNGPQAVVLNHAVACLPSNDARSLSLVSLIGHADSTGAGGLDNDTWYGVTEIRVAPITGTSVSLDSPWEGISGAVLSSTNASPIAIYSPAHGLKTGDNVTVIGHEVNTNANTTTVVTVVDEDHFTLNGSDGNGVGSDSGGWFLYARTTSTYKRETLPLTMAATALQVVNDLTGGSGTIAHPVAISGGYSFDDEDITGETWIDGQNQLGVGVEFADESYVEMEKVGAVRFATGFHLGGGTNNVLDTPGANSCGDGIVGDEAAILHDTLTVVGVASNTGHGLKWAGRVSSIDVIICTGNADTGVELEDYASNNTLSVSTIAVCGRSLVVEGPSNIVSVNGVFFNDAGPWVGDGQKGVVSIPFSYANGGPGLLLGADNVVKVATRGNDDDVSILFLSSEPRAKLVNSSFDEATALVNLYAGNGAQVESVNDNFAGETVMYCDGGDTTMPMMVTTDSAVTFAGGESLRINPSMACRSLDFPVELVLETVEVKSGTPYIAKCKARRDSLLASCHLLLRGNQVLGVPVDIQSSDSVAAVNSWEDLTLPTFTPEQDGSIDVVVQVWDTSGVDGNAEHIWLDHFSIGDATAAGVTATSAQVLSPAQADQQPSGPADILHTIGWVGDPLPLLARLIDRTKAVILPSEVATLAYTVYDKDLEFEVVQANVPVDIDATIHDDLSTGGGWDTDIDATGWNFDPVLPGSLFAKDDHTYRIVYTFTDGAGATSHWVIEHLAQATDNK